MSNSIWKTPDVKPDGKDTYIAITTDGLICDFVSPKMCDNSVDRWAYLTDIIAQADKAELLQKAVDNYEKVIVGAMFAPDVGEVTAGILEESHKTIEQMIKEQ